MSYTNLHLTPNDQEFKEKYQSVIAAVAQLDEHGEVEATFTTANGAATWRKRCYEYQKITGKTFRVELAYGHTLILRRKKRRPVGDHGLVDVKPVVSTDEPPDTTESVPDAEGTVVTEEDMAFARKILDRIAKKEGADESRRPEPRGDAADTGSHGGND